MNVFISIDLVVVGWCIRNFNIVLQKANYVFDHRNKGQDAGQFEIKNMRETFYQPWYLHTVLTPL